MCPPSWPSTPSRSCPPSSAPPTSGPSSSTTKGFCPRCSTTSSSASPTSSPSTPRRTGWSGTKRASSVSTTTTPHFPRPSGPWRTSTPPTASSTRRIPTLPRSTWEDSTSARRWARSSPRSPPPPTPTPQPTNPSSVGRGGLYKRKGVGALFTALSVASDSMKKEQKDWMGIDVPKPVTTVLRKLKKKKKRGVAALKDDDAEELKKLVREEEDAKDDAVWLQDYASDALYVFNNVERLGTLNDERKDRFTTILVALLSKELNDYSFLYRKLGIVCVFLSENLYLLLTRVLVKIAERSVRQNVFDKVFMPWNEQLYTVVFLPMFKVLETKHRVNFLVEEASRRVMNALNTQLLLDVCKFKCGTSGVASRFSSGALRAGAFVFPRFAWATASNEKLVDNIASELRTFFNIFSVTAFEDDTSVSDAGVGDSVGDSLLTTALVRDVMAKNNRKRLLPTASSALDLEGEDAVGNNRLRLFL